MIHKPNLFIVGMPKSGTTSLYYYLKQHPDIFMSEAKEPMYFCKDFTRSSIDYHKKIVGHKNWKKPKYSVNLKDYLKLFSNVKNERIIGEATVFYLYSKVAAKNIYKFNPNAKVIIMLRNPTNFLYSYHSQIGSRGGETIANFKKALESEKDRKKGKNIPRSIRFPEMLYYSELVHYVDQIKRYVDLFSKNQIKIILFDDFKEQPKKVYLEILNFLGVSKNFVPVFKAYNTNKQAYLRRIKGFFTEPIFLNLVGIILPKKIRKTLKIFFFLSTTKIKKREELEPNFEQLLMRKFKSTVVELDNYLYKLGYITKKGLLVHLWSIKEAHIDLKHSGKKLIIAFSGFARTMIIPQFDFLKTTQNINKKRILFRDSERVWYHTGIKGIGKNIDEVADYINNIVSKHGINELIMVGTSAGGYAAILFGIKCNAQRVYAFSPQTVLDENIPEEFRATHGRSIQFKEKFTAAQDRLYLDLKKVFKECKNTTTKFKIYYPRFNRKDNYHAKWLTDIPNVKLIPCFTLYHNTARYLKSKGKIKNIIIDNS